MSVEAQITIRATFQDEDQAELATSELKKSLHKNEHELASALDKLNPIENQKDYKNESINVEEISRKKNVLSIFAYSYSSEEPTWFAKSLYELGAKKIFIRGQWDGYGRNYYFLAGKKVSKKIYEGDKPKKALSAKDIEINKNLFLPDNRVQVKATLVNYWEVGDIYESILMKFLTDEGNTFYHKATGQLLQIAYEGYLNECEFSATFERRKLDGEYASFAIRPTKVILSNTGNVGDLKSKSEFDSKSLISAETHGDSEPKSEFNTKAKCPYCGSSLRTEQAKQCPSCFKN